MPSDNDHVVMGVLGNSVLSFRHEDMLSRTYVTARPQSKKAEQATDKFTEKGPNNDRLEWLKNYGMGATLKNWKIRRRKWLVCILALNEGTRNRYGGLQLDRVIAKEQETLVDRFGLTRSEKLEGLEEH